VSLAYPPPRLTVLEKAPTVAFVGAVSLAPAEKDHASKPEAQAEGARVFDPQIAFPRLAARFSQSSALPADHQKPNASVQNLQVAQIL